MAYIEPDSIIQLFKGIPLNNKYTDTILFGSYSAQETYFNDRVFKSYPKQYYQRVERGACKVEENAEVLYGINYMRFKNLAYGNRWFYAFVTSVEYINDNVTEIRFEIDDLQTWWFSLTLQKCYVEREHSADDIIGDHILPEPVELDEPVCQGVQTAGLNELDIVMTVVTNDQGHIVGNIIDGIFTPSYRVVKPATGVGAAEMAAEIDTLMNQPSGANAIMSLIMAPHYFADNVNPTPKTLSVQVSKPQTLAGYTPNNKKLLTYPYSYLSVDCINDVQVYKYELFGNEVATFECTGITEGQPSVICAPVDYEINQRTNYTHQLIMGGYPQCAIPIESYRQWLASSGLTNYVTQGAGWASVIGGSIVGSIGAMAAGIGAIAKTGIERFVESERANTARSGVSSNVNGANRTKDFYFKQMCVRREVAEYIDNFFSRYGYACQRIKVPNTNVRKRWTYTKTNGCIVTGDIPAESATKISTIFDRGITFWNIANGNVGDYVLNDNGVI